MFMQCTQEQEIFLLRSKKVPVVLSSVAGPARTISGDPDIPVGE
jgi:hypothetical protein